MEQGKILGYTNILFNLDTRKETRREDSEEEKRWSDKRKTMEIISHRRQGKIPF